MNIQIYNIAQLRNPHPPQHCSMLQSTSSLRVAVQIQIPAERPEADNYWGNGTERRRRTNESARLTPFFAFYNCTAPTLSRAMAAESGRLWHILPAETLPALPQKYSEFGPHVNGRNRKACAVFARTADQVVENSNSNKSIFSPMVSGTIFQCLREGRQRSTSKSI